MLTAGVLLLALATPRSVPDHASKSCTPLTQRRDCGRGRVCTGEPPQCTACSDDEQCLLPQTVCAPNDDPAHRICRHKALLPLSVREVAGFALVALSSALAAGGGIGGGGMLVPILVLLFGFSPHDATPLSNVAIFGGSLANLLVNAPKRHPVRDKPLISYEMALLMEPMTMLGALAGCILNRIFPGWLISLLLVVILALTARRTLQKGWAAWNRDTGVIPSPVYVKERISTHENDEDDKAVALLSDDKLSAATAAAPATSTSCRYSLSFGAEPERAADDPTRSLSSEADLDGEVAFGATAVQLDDTKRARRRIHARECVPAAQDILILVALLASCLAVSFLRDELLGVSCGSAEYWLLYAAELVLILVASLGARTLLIRRHTARVACGYRFLPDDVKWDERNTHIYPLLCVGAGLCAGMFGIGGGIVKGPLMLEMGILPLVASATASYMIIYTSATASLSYFLFGQLEMEYAAFLFCIGFLATLVGQWGLFVLLKRYRKQSLIVILIGTIIGVSAVAMGVVGCYNFVTALRRGQDQGFRPLCFENHV